jgi:hypothetical protein
MGRRRLPMEEQRVQYSVSLQEYTDASFEIPDFAQIVEQKICAELGITYTPPLPKRPKKRVTRMITLPAKVAEKIHEIPNLSEFVRNIVIEELDKKDE